MKSKESALEKAAQPESIIESNNIRKSRYFVSFDDSSDEEDSVESYNISKNLKSQYDKPAFPALQYKFSFITHALALQLFYSKPVQDKYYILKKQYLSYQENELPSHEKVKEWVEAAMYEVLLENYFRLPEGYDEISQTICKKFMAENQNQLQAIIDKITEDCGALFHALSTKNYQRVIDKIKNELIELLDQVAQFIDTQVDPSPPSQKDITRETLSHLSDLNETLESIDSNEIKESIEYIPTTENNRITGSKKNKKKVEKDLANPITPVQKAIKDCHKGLSDSGPGVLSENFMTRVTEHTVQLRLHDLIKNKEESKTYKEIEDYMVKHGFGEFDIKVHLQKNIDEIQMNNISIRINIRLFQETENLEYQTPPTQIDRIDNNAASDELLEYNSLNNIMKNLNLVSRKTLEDSFIFDLSHTENNFYTEFLATLRLCNRSFIRMLKDRTALDGDYGYYLKKEGLSRSWKFPASKHHIIDIHSLTGSKDELRQDQTESVGSYASIFNTIKNIKSLIYKCYNCNVEDADIANLIRSIMNGDKLDQFSNLNTNKENYQNISARHKDLILKDLVRISYVMFGSEVVRNPASIIHNLMILDMIIKDKMSWEDALYSFFRPVDMNDNNESDGGILPMSMKEAVMAARTLHNEYSKRMPIPYKYDRAFYSNNPRCADLMKREHEITKKWLEMRQATSSNPEEKNEEITLESQIRQIANFLQEQLKIPLSLIEPDTQSDNISEKQLQTSSSLIESSSSSLLQNVESEDEQVEILTEKFAEVSIKPSAKVSFDKIDLLSYNTPYVKPVKKEQQNMKDVREKLLTKAQETLEEIYNTIGWGKTYESKKPAAITEERILQQIEKEASTFEEEYRELYKDIIGKIRDLKQKELPDIITVSSARETLSKTVSDIKTGLESSKQSTKKEEDTTQSKTTSTSTYKNKPFEAEFKEINIISELLYDFSSDDSSTQSQNNLLAKLYYDLGNLYCKIGRLEHGSIAYTNATELDSSYENAYVNAITTYFIQGFSIEVLSVCKELVKISPPLNRSFAYLLSSIALKDIGLEEEAKNVLQKFLETAEPVTKSLETLSQAALVESSDKPSDEMPIATSDYEELITMVRDGILSNIVPDWQMDEISNWRGARIEYDTKDSLNRRVVREYYQKILDPLRTEVTKRLQDNPPNNQETIEQKTQEAVVRKTEDDLGDVKVVAKWIEDIIGKCQSFSKLYTSYKAKLAITKSESIESASQKKFIIDAMVDYTSTIHKEVHIISDEVQTLRAHGSQEDSVDQAFLHYLKQNQTLPGYKFLYQVVESTLLGETNQAYEDIFDQN